MGLQLDFILNKSSKRLSDLHPTVKIAAEKLIINSYKRGVPIVITQGLRTFAEQNALYAQGRYGDKRPIVTNAKAGESFHNYGVAIDFALLLPDGKNVSWDMQRDGDGDRQCDWLEVVEEAKKLGFIWGGDWSGFKDYPHFEMTCGLTIKDFQAGKRPPVVKESIKEDEDNMPLHLNDYEWKMLNGIWSQRYNKGEITDWKWIDKIRCKQLNAGELAFLNTVVAAKKDCLSVEAESAGMV
ncbi:M15 family metallopeptidase [Paenibacillus chitinolyticus]|uniref:M15 family metallopeptidase n=1 Tax=Paenibacillus chitinolyticus TaxID=79263 RepID=UPI00366DD361